MRFVIILMICASHPASAGPHKDCVERPLNTYQHADCEEAYAKRELKKLEEIVRTLERETCCLQQDVSKAHQAFLRHVLNDCLLEGDATFGTMGTYLVEECRSTRYKERQKWMQQLLEEARDQNKYR